MVFCIFLLHVLSFSVCILSFYASSIISVTCLFLLFLILTLTSLFLFYLFHLNISYFHVIFFSCCMSSLSLSLSLSLSISLCARVCVFLLSHCYSSFSFSLFFFPAILSFCLFSLSLSFTFFIHSCVAESPFIFILDAMGSAQINGSTLAFGCMGLGAGETGSMYVASYKVPWYIHIYIYICSITLVHGLYIVGSDVLTV